MPLGTERLEDCYQSRATVCAPTRQVWLPILNKPIKGATWIVEVRTKWPPWEEGGREPVTSSVHLQEVLAWMWGWREGHKVWSPAQYGLTLMSLGRTFFSCKKTQPSDKLQLSPGGRFLLDALRVSSIFFSAEKEILISWVHSSTVWARVSLECIHSCWQVSYRVREWRANVNELLIPG